MTMESYWQAVLHEVKNKDNAHCSFKYTNIGPEEPPIESTSRSGKKLAPECKKKFFVGEGFPSVYFTQREFDCVVELLRGCTVKQIAAKLDLSPRTVEYYIKNLKNKLNCNTRSELMDRALQVDFVKEVFEQARAHA